MPPSPESKELLEKLGYYDGGTQKNNLKASYDSDFAALAGDLDSYIGINLFVDSNEQMFGMSIKLSRSLFMAMDLRCSGNMYRHDYILFRVTFLENLRDPLLSKYRYRAVFYYHNQCEDGTWSDSDMQSFVRNICSDDYHVRKISSKIFPDKFNLSIEDFLSMLGSSEFGYTLHDSALSRNAIMNMILEDIDDADFDQCEGKNGGEYLQEYSLHNQVAEDYKSEDLKTRTQYTAGSPIKIAEVGDGLPSYGRVVIDHRPLKAITRDVSTPLLSKVKSELLPFEGLNSDFEYDECFDEQGDWRGVNAVPRGCETYELANSILNVMSKLTNEIVTMEHNKDVSDFEWKLGGEILRRMLTSKSQSMASSRDMARKICLLSNACREIVREECTLVDVPSPCKVYGDIHGQLRDILLLFLEFGKPTDKGGDIETTCYVFNGDWVDRGAHQLEVVLIIFALKVMYPARVFLVRGNHEFKDDCLSPMPFKHAVGQFFSCKELHADVCQAVYAAFSYMPISALINRKILVVHGGIGNGLFSLDNLRHDVPRPLVSVFDDSIPDFIRQVLWSDPTDSDDSAWNGTHGNSDRGHSIRQFGPDVTKEFCKLNGVDMIVRSHQDFSQGYKLMHSGHLITIFSARNYYHRDNCGAFLLVTPDVYGDLRVRPKVIRAAKQSVQLEF